MRKLLLTSSFMLITAGAFAQGFPGAPSFPPVGNTGNVPSSMVSPEGSSLPNGGFISPGSPGNGDMAPAQQAQSIPLPSGMILPPNSREIAQGSGAPQNSQPLVAPQFTQTAQPMASQPMMQIAPPSLPNGGFVTATGASMGPPPSAGSLPTTGFVPVDGSSNGTVAGMTVPGNQQLPPGGFQQLNSTPNTANSFSVQPGVYPGANNNQPSFQVNGQQGQNGQNGQQAVMVPNPVVGYTAQGQPIFMTPQDSVPSQGYRMNGLALTPAPGSPPPVPAMGTDEFNRAMRQLAPMTPSMIRQFKEVVGTTEKEMSRPAGGAPRPRSKALNLTLKPGEDPPVLHLYPGNATAITFVDVTGAPWPVMDVTPGDPSVMDAHAAGEKGKSNIVIVSPKTNYTQARNMIVTLVNYPVPIAFQIETGDGSVDYRIDISLRAQGPNAAQDVMSVSTLAPTNDRVMQAFVDGVPPREAHKMRTSHPEVDAWSYQDMVYIRTPLEVLSPAYVARSNRNVTGVRVYTMTDSPVVLVSQGGKLVSVSVTR